MGQSLSRLKRYLERLVERVRVMWNFKIFTDDENGAVTVDWVVLSAAVVGLAAFGVLQTQQGVFSVAGRISSSVASQPVN